MNKFKPPYHHYQLQLSAKRNEGRNFLNSYYFLSFLSLAGFYSSIEFQSIQVYSKSCQQESAKLN